MLGLWVAGNPPPLPITLWRKSLGDRSSGRCREMKWLAEGQFSSVAQSCRILCDSMGRQLGNGERWCLFPSLVYWFATPLLAAEGAAGLARKKETEISEAVPWGWLLLGPPGRGESKLAQGVIAPASHLRTPGPACLSAPHISCEVNWHGSQAHGWLSPQGGRGAPGGRWGGRGREAGGPRQWDISAHATPLKSLRWFISME